MASNQKPKRFQELFEVNVWALVIGLLLVLSVGGIVEIVPLFLIDSTTDGCWICGES